MWVHDSISINIMTFVVYDLCPVFLFKLKININQNFLFFHATFSLFYIKYFYFFPASIHVGYNLFKKKKKS